MKHEIHVILQIQRTITLNSTVLHQGRVPSGRARALVEPLALELENSRQVRGQEQLAGREYLADADSSAVDLLLLAVHPSVQLARVGPRGDGFLGTVFLVRGVITAEISNVVVLVD